MCLYVHQGIPKSLGARNKHVSILKYLCAKHSNFCGYIQLLYLVRHRGCFLLYNHILCIVTSFPEEFYNICKWQAGSLPRVVHLFQSKAKL